MIVNDLIKHNILYIFLFELFLLYFFLYKIFFFIKIIIAQEKILS
jgi:hypothetical protein